MAKERLKSLLCDLGISASKLSRDLGRTASYVTNIVNGRNHNPSPYFYDYLEQRYNVSIAWLKTGEGEMYRHGGKRNDLTAGAMVRQINLLSPEERQCIVTILKAFEARHAQEMD